MRHARGFGFYAWTAAIMTTSFASQTLLRLASTPEVLSKEANIRSAAAPSMQDPKSLRHGHDPAAIFTKDAQMKVCELSSEQVQTCLDSCSFRSPICLDLNCDEARGSCTMPHCCVAVKQDKQVLITTTCYRGCCSATDENGKATTPFPCTTSGASCFPGSAIVELHSGAYKRLDQLAIGDRVRVSEDEFSDVFMFTHRQQESFLPFTVIRLASNHTIRLTEGHYVYVYGELRPAGVVKVGDELALGSGGRSEVVSVSESFETGLYNPHTLHGDIVVNGVVSSTYTTAVSPVHGHVWLGIFRLLYGALGLKLTWLESGAEFSRKLLPAGRFVE
jgi:hypothetical protein